MKNITSFLSLTAIALCISSPAMGKSWIESPSAETRTEARLTTGQPVVMRTESPFTNIMVADEKVADVVVLTDRSFHLQGKTNGRTNIMLYDDDQRLLDVVDVTVGTDIPALKKGLYDMFPGERIEVRELAGGIYLSGKVSSNSVSERAYQVAQRFAPDNVTNGMIVKDSHQVMLEVRFVEASRDAVKDLGVGLLVQNPSNFGGAGYVPDAGDYIGGSRGGLLGGAIGAGGLTLLGQSNSIPIDITIDALEEKGIIRTLAEPNVVAMSGETASFLAGGEFPVPIEGQNGAVTIQYRQFGVSLGFTPTVLDDGVINLKVAPEVSQLDTTRSVRIGGVEVPALSVRRADTTVELRNDQSFAIAGLLQNSSSDSTVQVPWLGDVPVLGSLFRSTRYKKNETELVIIITPRLVQPVSDINELATPADGLTRPSDAAKFLLGHNEGPKTSGGLSGDYGYSLQ